jgi:hypothetical protein
VRSPHPTAPPRPAPGQALGGHAYWVGRHRQIDNAEALKMARPSFLVGKSPPLVRGQRPCPTYLARLGQPKALGAFKKAPEFWLRRPPHAGRAAVADGTWCGRCHLVTASRRYGRLKPIRTAGCATNTLRPHVKVSHQEMVELNIKGNAFHPEWNYIISPNQQPP